MTHNPYESPRGTAPPLGWRRLLPSSVGLRQLTVIEWFVILAIVVVVISIFLPEGRFGPHGRRSAPPPAANSGS